MKSTAPKLKCNCIAEIDAKLSKHNLTLSGISYIWPSMKAYPQIATSWIDKDKAPKGIKKNPPGMFASYCPWCGIELEKKVPPNA